MARLFISPADGDYVAGPSQTDIAGTDGVEHVILAGNSKTNFNGSFNQGGDTITIQGNASLYTARLSGTNVILTAANGANIVIPAGPAGITIEFLDDPEGREMYLDTTLGKIFIGEQQITTAGVLLNGDVVGPPASTVNLTVGQDILDGTAGNDLFRARVAQNANGEQANQLGSGDVLDGGAGTDRLLATVQDASALNAGPASSIAPETVDVEIAHFTARSTGLTLDDLEIDEIARLFSGFIGESEFFGSAAQLGVEINAADMWGLDEVGSLNSDDSLTIYNLTTLTDSGVYSQRRTTDSITVRMDHSGNGELVELESDLTVLFDQNYLLAGNDVEQGAQLVIEIMDLDAALQGRDPLEDNPFGEIDFLLGGQLYTLTYGTDANTYAELLADVQAALELDPAFANLTAAFGGTFVASDTDNDPGGSAVGQSIVITNSGPEELEAVTMRAIGDAPAGKDFHTNFLARDAEIEEQLITSEIVLNKVGRGGDGGDLTVGGMNTDGANIWGYGSSPTQGPVKGIEQFNITVEGDDTQPTDLASLQSTNNQLRVVNLESAAGSEATFTLGNNNTGNYPLLGTSLQPNEFFDDTFGGSQSDLSTFRNLALKDVLIFNAVGFVNDSEVWGYFSDEAVAKYMDLEDGADNPAFDNANALYSFGAGDNVLNMNLSKSNFAASGTESREDFSFTADMGAGNDTVQIQIGDGVNAIGESSGESFPGFDFDSASMFDFTYENEDGLQTVQNWYTNHVINGGLASPVANLTQNLVINTGAGDDSVELWGATAADVNLGSGNDWVFTDNSGQIPDGTSSEGSVFNNGKATWVFNQRTSNVNDLQSQTPVAITNVANLALTVTFQGQTATVDVGGSRNSINGVTVSDLTINQAIKAAINGDPFLNKLLVAEDGPGRTLIVRSLIDGEHVTSDLGIALSSTGALSPAQIAGSSLALGDLTGNLLDVSTLGFLPNGQPSTALAQNRWDSEFGFDSFSSSLLRGFDSINVNNNNVEGDTGNDLIVLSSNGVGLGIGVNSSVLGSSTETIDINGVFGEDRLLNFTAAVGSADQQEIQTVTFSGDPLTAGTAAIDLPDGFTDVSYNFADTTTVTTIAQELAALIDAQPGIAASAVAGVVTITYEDDTVNYSQAVGSLTPSTSLAEVQTITFSGTPVAGEVVSVTFGAGSTLTTNSYTVQAGDGVDEVANAIAAAFAADGFPVGNADNTDGILTLTNTAPGNIPNATISVTSSQTSTLNFAVAETDAGEEFGVTVSQATLQNGGPPAPGYDIFDVTTVLNGAVSLVDNDTQIDNIEAASIQGVEAGNHIVAITDTVEQNDYAFDVNYTGADAERLRILEIARDADTTSQATATDGIVITVDGTTNIGTFYHLVNGTGISDVTVTRLGSIDLGTYNDPTKTAIGDWDLMTITNFTPLNVDGLEGTYDVIG